MCALNPWLYSQGFYVLSGEFMEGISAAKSAAQAEKPKRKSVIVQALTRGVKLLFNKAFYVLFSMILQILWWGLLFVVRAA